MRGGLIALALLLVPVLSFAQQSSYPTWTCSLDGVDTTLTLCAKAQMYAPYRLVVTDIVAQSTTSTAGQFTLRYGTGANCGTGTGTLFPAAAGTTARLAAPANTVAATIISLRTGIYVPTGNDVCVLGVATNTVSIVVGGYLAP